MSQSLNFMESGILVFNYMCTVAGVVVVWGGIEWIFQSYPRNKAVPLCCIWLLMITLVFVSTPTYVLERMPDPVMDNGSDKDQVLKIQFGILVSRQCKAYQECLSLAYNHRRGAEIAMEVCYLLLKSFENECQLAKQNMHPRSELNCFNIQC